MSAGGWFIRGIVSDLRELQKDIASHRLHVSETYAKKDDYQELRDWLDKQFDRLHQELKSKADK